MNYIIVTVALILMSGKATGQAEKYIRDVDHLKKELLLIDKKENQYRQLLRNLTPKRVDSLALAFKIKPNDVFEHLIKLQTENDSANIKDIRYIFSKFEYPGKTLVGEPSNLIAWKVVTHAHNPALYFPRVNQAYIMGEIPDYTVAALEDCALFKNNKRQRYGYHISFAPYTDSVSGKKLAKLYISPLEKPEHVNERRKERGFSTTIENYATTTGAIFLPKLTVADFEQIMDGKLPVKN